jgi:hypothetical protein
MKFVDEGPKVRRVTRTPAINNSSTSTVGRVDKRSNHEQTNIASFHHGTRKQAFRLNQPSISNIERNQLLSSFISAMFPLGAASAQTSFLGSWLRHVPPRLGNSAALDHAASSVAWAYFAKLSADKAILRRAEISYIRAVKSLAAALDDPKQRLDSNVLCATLLLGHYEVCLVLPRCFDSTTHISRYIRPLSTLVTPGFDMPVAPRDLCSFGVLNDVTSLHLSTLCSLPVAEQL